MSVDPVVQADHPGGVSSTPARRRGRRDEDAFCLLRFDLAYISGFAVCAGTELIIDSMWPTVPEWAYHAGVFAVAVLAGAMVIVCYKRRRR